MRQKRYSVVNVAGKPAEAGVIVKVYCENFMCHRKLSINLCSNVNFIHGQNGSGKSAILAALQICLGARANVTHRGSKLGDMIRQGHDGHAVVRVSLLNKGADAFEHEKYGDYVTIERRIDRHASGCGYRLLKGDPRPQGSGRNLQPVSKKKEDLDRMLDLFNIQIENPCALLDQENAKRFIQGDPGEKFKFFERATDIDRLDKQLADGRTIMRETKAALEQQMESLPRLKKECKELMKQVESMEGLEKKEEEIKHLKVQIAWSEARKKEEAWKETRKAVSKNELQVDKIKTMEAAAHAEKETQEKDVEELEERMRGLREKVKEARTKMVEVKGEMGKRRLPITKLQSRVAGKTEEIKGYLLKKKKKQREMEAEQERLKEQGEADLGPLVHKRKELEEEKLRLEERKEGLARELETGRREVEDAKKAAMDARSEVQAAERRVKGLEGELNVLGKGGIGGDNNPVAVYGEGAGRVVREMEKMRSRFRDSPVGPIGLHIKVKDGKQEWGGSVENAIGSILSGFIVTNHEDRRVLQDIMRRCGTQASVFTLPAGQRRHTLRPPECSNPHNGVAFVMLADCIAVDNDLVWNCLVDWARMDGSAFTRTMKEAETLAGSGRRFPPPMKSVYDCEGWLTEYKSGSSIQRSVEYGNGRGGTGRRRLGLDVSVMRTNLQRELGLVKEELERARKEAGGCERRVQALERKLKELKAELRREEEKGEKVQDSIREVGEAIRDATDMKESKVDFDGLQREIDAYSEQVKELQTRQAEEKEEMERLEEELRPLAEREANEKKIMKNLEKEVVQDQKRIEDGLMAIDEKEAACKKLEMGLLKAEEMGRKLQKALVQATGEVEEAMELVRTYTRNALGEDWDGEDVVPSSTREQLSKTLKEKERGLVLARAQHQMRDTVAIVRQKAQNAREAYVGKKKQIEELERNMLKLQQGMERRKTKLKGFRKYIVRRADQAFDRVLQHKGQSGTLSFNHKTKELGIEVQKDARDETTTSKNVRELSGGERSYATLALLIALGEAIECPFRVMDEFDIFMDAVARKTALDLLVQTATGEDMRHRQFIFITPQDLSHVQGKISDVFKVHKLGAPIRTEGRLQQQTL